MTHPYTIATRLLLAAVLSVGLTLTVSAALAPQVDADPNLTVNLQWQNQLNDAPCGVAESSPVLFNDNGTPAVEVGDREGNLYAFDLANPASPGDPSTPAPGWPDFDRGVRRRRHRLQRVDPGGRHDTDGEQRC